MIQVEHLTKLYGAKTAIADVSFSVEKGEVLAFLGPNGAGKTTTVRILTASLPATSGSEPPVLILDEPTLGLDPKQIIEIRQLIRELAGSRTIILSTHILPEATAVAKRVVIINEGRIVAEDTQEQLSACLRRSEKVSLTLKRPAPDVRDCLLAIPGVLSVHQEGANTFLVEAELGHDLDRKSTRLNSSH